MDRPGLRTNRSWNLLLTGGTISSVGDYVFDTTMVLWIGTVIAKGQPWAPLAVSGVLIAAAVPALVVGPLAGVFVDRWNRRRIMLVSEICRAALCLALLPLAWPSVAGHVGRPAELALIYVVIFGLNTFGQFANPARFTLLFSVVDPDDQAQASGLTMASQALAGIIGPPIAAPLLFVFGVQWALVIDAASYLVSFAAIILVTFPAGAVAPTAGQEHASFFSEFQAGIRFFATSHLLIAITLGAVIATLGTGVINSLNVFFVTDNLHVAAKWYGTLGLADGIGAILGALATGIVVAKIAPKRLFWSALVVAGILVIVYSRMSVLIAAIVALVLIGMVVGTLNGAIMPMILGAVPQEMLGRSFAVFGPLQQLANVTSIAVAGVLASTALRNLHAHFAGMTFGPYDTLFSVAGLLFIAGGLASIPLLRSAPDPSPAASPAPAALIVSPATAPDDPEPLDG
jgi:MFS family permease